MRNYSNFNSIGRSESHSRPHDVVHRAIDLEISDQTRGFSQHHDNLCEFFGIFGRIFRLLEIPF